MATERQLAQLRQDGVDPGTAIFTQDTPSGAYIWHVTAALALVEARPRPAHIVSPALMQQTLQSARVDPAKVATAHPEEPGLVAPYFDPSRHYWRLVVIDGNHRLYKAYQTGYPFACYELNPGESWRVMLAYPESVEPTVYLKHLECQGNCLRTKSPPAPRVPSGRLGRGVLPAPLSPSRRRERARVVAAGRRRR